MSDSEVGITLDKIFVQGSVTVAGEQVLIPRLKVVLDNVEAAEAFLVRGAKLRLDSKLRAMSPEKARAWLESHKSGVSASELAAKTAVDLAAVRESAKAELLAARRAKGVDLSALGLE